MSFASALESLNALGLELAPGAPRRKFELAHMRTFAAALGDPHTSFPSVLIAGTNGKGSTAATLASILAAAGYRTGLYTSPHLERVTERIRILEPSTQSAAPHLEEMPERTTAGSPSKLRLGGIAPQKMDAVIPSGAVRQHSAVEGPPHLPLPFRTAPRDPHTDQSASPDPCSLIPVPCFTEIPEADFARLYFHVDETGRQLASEGRLPQRPSYFETLTALAFLYFAQRQVDIAVLEVGLGGRLDATNIVDPLLSVITDIALDHQEYLGPTIAAIAREKAGILRPGGTLVTLPQHPEANQAIGEVAMELNVRGLNAAPYLPGRDFGVEAVPPSAGPWGAVPGSIGALAPGLRPNHYDLSLDGQTLRIRSPLLGEHQQRNIALAIAAAIALRNVIDYRSLTERDTRNSISYNISNSAIEAGISHASWPGRLEFLAPNLLLDVAHNPAGAWTLRAAIALLPESQPRTLLFSCLRDKDLREMAQILFPLFDSTGWPIHPASRDEWGTSQRHIVLAPVDSPRAAPLDDLVAAARALDVPAQSAASTAEALALARRITPPGGLIVVTGSIYLVGAIRGLAGASHGAP